MNTRDLIRLVPQKTIESIMRLDAAVLSTDPANFTKDNGAIYDLAINTWLLCIKEYAPLSWVAVANRIFNDGLVATVSLMKTGADALVKNEELPPLPKSIYMEVSRRGDARNVLRVEYDTSLSAIGICLFLFRYLKRVTPLHADKLSTVAIDDFVNNQRRLKNIQRRGFNTFILDLVRSEINESIIRERIQKWSAITMGEIEITPGICYTLDGKRLSTLASKHSSLIEQYGWDSLSVQRASVWDFQLGNEAFLTAVPKTISSARTIAPEQLLRQAVAHRMFSLCDKSYPGIDLSDQTVNQEKARVGSINGNFATIDLSHASDDITWSLVQEIYLYYPEYLHYLAQIRPTYLNINRTVQTSKGKNKTSERRLLQSFATMGNSFTFINETEIFWLITRAAVHFAQRHIDASIPEGVVVYGDDIICASAAAPTVLAFLEKLGFVPNVEKSYFDCDSGLGYFRESCGKDYYCGEDVSSPYFPRRPLTGLESIFRGRDSQLMTAAQSLIALQHRLFDVSAQAGQYVELFLREQQPHLGYSHFGTQCDDLWGYDVQYTKVRYIPQFRFETVDDEPRWILDHGRWVLRTKRVLRRTTVEDELHRVCYQLRPVVSVDKGEHNSHLVYNEYLRIGPYYATELDRTLGVSTSRFNIPTGAPHSEWKQCEC